MALSIDSTTGAYLTSPQYQSEVLGSVHAQSIFLNLCSVLQTTKKTTYLPKVNASPEDFEFLAEGATKPETSITFSQDTVALKKIAEILAFSDESVMRADSGLIAMLKDEMSKSLSTTIDTALFQGVVDTDNSDGVDGLLTQSGYLTQAYGSESDFGEDIRYAIRQIAAQNHRPSAIVMHSTAKDLLLSIRTASTSALKYETVNSRTPSVWGLPIIECNNISTTTTTDGSSQSNCIIADWKSILVASGPLETKIADQATLTSSGNLWEQDLQALRVVKFISEPLLRRLNAICVVEDVVA